MLAKKCQTKYCMRALRNSTNERALRRRSMAPAAPCGPRGALPPRSSIPPPGRYESGLMAAPPLSSTRTHDIITRTWEKKRKNICLCDCTQTPFFPTLRDQSSTMTPLWCSCTSATNSWRDFTTSHRHPLARARVNHARCASLRSLSPILSSRRDRACPSSLAPGRGGRACQVRRP